MSHRSRGWFNRLLIGVVALLLIAGALGRWRHSEVITPTPVHEAAGNLAPTTRPMAVTPRATLVIQRTDQGTTANLPPGFDPVPWTTTLPAGLTQGTVAYAVDGDTFEIVVDGVSSRYRIYHADTPETYPDAECGGREATDLVKTVLASSDTPGQVWIESVDQRDKYGRKLAYLWLTFDGQPFQLNDALINSGWAENIDYGDAFNPYRDQLQQAEDDARVNRRGVWALCGAFGVPIGSTAALATSAPVLDKRQPAAANLVTDCNPNYSPCVPNVPYDLDCADIGFRVQVIGSDPYNLDNDDPDLIGCESY